MQPPSYLQIFRQIFGLRTHSTKEWLKDCILCFIHIQVLSCTFWKISSASTTPCLKMIRFLWSHLHLTTATHTPFQIRFWLLLTWNMWKLRKCDLRSFCWTKEISNHRKHIDHTLWAWQHSMKRCWADSSSCWHRGHSMELNCTPPLFKFTLVGSLSNNTLHAVTTAFGKACSLPQEFVHLRLITSFFKIVF